MTFSPEGNLTPSYMYSIINFTYWVISFSREVNNYPTHMSITAFDKV